MSGQPEERRGRRTWAAALMVAALAFAGGFAARNCGLFPGGLVPGKGGPEGKADGGKKPEPKGPRSGGTASFAAAELREDKLWLAGKESSWDEFRAFLAEAKRKGQEVELAVHVRKVTVETLRRAEEELKRAGVEYHLVDR